MSDVYSFYESVNVESFVKLLEYDFVTLSVGDFSISKCTQMDRNLSSY